MNIYLPQKTENWLLFQVCPWRVHALVEALENNTTLREGAFEVPGTRARIDWAWCYRIPW